MNKVYVLHENNDWMAPFRSALLAAGVPFEEWHMASRQIDFQSLPADGVYYNRMSASSHSRGHRYAPEYTSTVLDWLEFHGRRVINNSHALKLELSKSLQYKELQKEGIKVEVRHIKPEELGDFEEIFVTGTAAEITAVGQIDDHKYTVGPITKKLRSAYEELVNA